MSAGSAQEQIPTRTRSVGLDDLFVDAGWDGAVDVDRLRDVLEGLLPDALEDALDGRDHGRREPAGRHLVLVDQGIRLAPDRDVEAPKPRMSTITMSSPILIASRERNIAERSALRGLRDRLRELVRLFRIERPEAREHLSRLREPAHPHVRLAEVLERLRVLRAESQRFLVGLHGFLELPPPPQRPPHPAPPLSTPPPHPRRLPPRLPPSRPPPPP